MEEMFEYLDQISYMEPRVIKIRLKNYFDLDKDDADRVYRSWKNYYVKPKKI